MVELEDIYRSNQEEFEAQKKLGLQDFVDNKNEDLYYLIRDMYNGKIDKKYLDATLYYFINKTSYSGMLRFNKKKVNLMYHSEDIKISMQKSS